MPAKEYDYLKDTILVTYPDGPETYGATQAAPSSGADTSDATATADDIRANKTAYIASGKVTGTIEDYDGSSEPASGKSLLAQMVDGSITEVSASDLAGATKIKDYAFYYCSSLTSITIPDSVTRIGNSVFENCSRLTSIMIPDSVTVIGGSTFQNCSSLMSITIPDGITNISGNMFFGCGKLTSITIPDSIKSILSNAFYSCHNLMSITIGNGITRIYDAAFNSCGTTTESGTTYTFLRTTPPIIQSNIFQNAKINKIIVPIGTANTYKAATNWSALADYIQEAEA